MEAQTVNPGFDDPVHDAQQTFRGILGALSRPGAISSVPASAGDRQAISAAAAAVLLSLVDYDTSVWFPPRLAETGIKDYLAFHCGCPFVEASKKAAFVYVSDVKDIPALENLAPGTPEYPDRSATLIIDLESFNAGNLAVHLSGPGIEDRTELNIAALDDAFWQLAIRNAERYPLGCDFIFCAGKELIALPRSTRIELPADAGKETA